LEIIGTASKSEVLGARQELGFPEVALDPATIPLSQFMLADRREEARSRPALLVRALGELRPDMLDGRQAQLVEDKAQAPRIDRRTHAASPT
jgi:hypothetical protein